MQRFLFFLLLSAFSATTVLAQASGDNKTTRAESIALDYAEALDMSAEQRQMATKVFAKHLADSRNNWHSADGEREAYAAAQKETFKATDAKIKAMLNDEQLALYTEKRMELKRKALDFYVSQHVKQ